jgi:hypothetical protein
VYNPVALGDHFSRRHVPIIANCVKYMALTDRGALFTTGEMHVSKPAPFLQAELFRTYPNPHE